MKKRSFLFVFLLFFSIGSIMSQKTTLNVGVGQTYLTIQAAVDAASNGDTVNIVDPSITECNIIVYKNVTIQGHGAFHTTLDGGSDPLNPQGRIFIIPSGATVVIQDLTITHGGAMPGTYTNTGVPGEDGGDGESGGAILNGGILTVKKCMFIENFAGSGIDGIMGYPGPNGNDIGGPGSFIPGGLGQTGGNGGNGGNGGAIANAGCLTVENSTFVHNTAGDGGLGADGGPGGNGADGISIGGSIHGADGGDGGDGGFGGNGGNGGAIANFDGTATVTNSTFFENSTGMSNSAGSGGFGGHGGHGADNLEGGVGGDGGNGGNGGTGGDAGIAGYGGAIANDSGTVNSVNNTISQNITGECMALPGGGGTGGDGGNSGFGELGPGIPGNGGNGGTGGTGACSGEGGGIANNIGGSFPIINTIVAFNMVMVPMDYSGGPGGAPGNPGFDPLGGMGLPGNPGANGALGSSMMANDCFGVFASEGFNIIYDPTGSTGWTYSDFLGVDPLLQHLEDNGGPTTTMAILVTSPANDGGTISGTTLTPPDHDQRLYNRQLPLYDIGAYEFRTISEDIVINEVDADQTSTDSQEFIEIYDGGTGNTPLDELIIVLYNGNGDVSYNAIELEGFSTDANGYFVIGSATVPNVDLVTFTTNGIQNGADAVALYKGIDINFPNGTVVIVNDSLVDALVYDTGDPDDAGLLILLNASEPQIDEDMKGAKDTESMQRIPNGTGGQRNTSTYTTTLPTPGEENVIPTPEIEVNPTSLDFGDVEVNSSSEMTYTVTATFLTDDLTVTAPTGYEVSLTSGSGFAGSIDIVPSSGEVDETVYVKFSPTSAILYSGNVTNESTDAVTKNVAVTGTGVDAGTPIITVNLTDIDFGEVAVGSDSILIYSVSGTNLTDDIEISLETGLQFTVSDDNSTFVTSLTLYQSGGTVPGTTIYVKYAPDANGPFTDNILNESSGATTRTVALSGDTPVGISETDNIEILIYPNPSNGIINISVDNKYYLEVLDITGKIIYTQNLDLKNTFIDLSNQKSGLYIMRFSNNNQTLNYKVLIK